MTLRVLTLNLWNEAGPWRERARCIRGWLDRLDPDLVGFQEVLRGPGRDQAQELLDGRGFHLDYARASAFGPAGELDFGNAVASRWPIADREALPLPDAGDGETRSALCVTVDAPVGAVSFCSTHLNWRFHHGAVRERQVVALGELLLRRRPRAQDGREGFPPIVVGDFNAEPDSAEIRYVSGLQSLEGRSLYLRDAWRHAGRANGAVAADPAGITWSNRNPYTRPWLEPDRRIDYVFVGPPRRDGVGDVTHCRVVCDEPGGPDATGRPVWPSDHFGVYAELRTQPIPDLTGSAGS